MYLPILTPVLKIIQSEVTAGTEIDCVPGVAQNPPCNKTPQLANPLHIPWHAVPPQNARSCVAKRQLVPGALMHAAAPLVIVVHGPAQADPLVIVLQNVTVTVFGKVSSRAESGLRSAAKGSPIKVMLLGSCASTHAFISARETTPACMFCSQPGTLV